MRSAASTPAVSVVVPTYNRAEDLRRCLGSLVAQRLNDFEVLVCDDGSSDHSAEVVAAFAGRLDVQFLTDTNFGGPARPRNRGIARARAPFIAFLDSDDWWHPDKLLFCMQAMDAGADVVYHDLYLVDDAGQTAFDRSLKSSQPASPMLRALLCTGISIPNSSVVVRKSLLERIGGICEEQVLVSVEDYDTWIRLATVTDAFVRIPKILGYYWVGGGNISAATPKQVDRIKALYARHLGRLTGRDLRVAEGFLHYRIGRLAQRYGDTALARTHLLAALAAPLDMEYRIKAMLFLLRTALSRRSR